MGIKTVTAVSSASMNCAWNVAVSNLRKAGVTVNNTTVFEEMERLATLNDCEDYKEFNKKFFSKQGHEFIIDKVSVADKTSKNNAAQRTAAKKRAAVDNTRQAYANLINSQNTDTDKIKLYNRTNYDGKHYAIIDKKNATLTIYDKNGNAVKQVNVGLGAKKGDHLNGTLRDAKGNRYNGKFTTAGEFILDEQNENDPEYTGKDGKYKFMSLRGDCVGQDAGQMGIHMCYKPEYKSRAAKIDRGDNRFSWGCVNVKEEDYDTFSEYLGEGDKVYILPEEEGNELNLEVLADGTYKFGQKYHKDDERGIPVELACAVDYDVHPERDPKNKKQVAEKTQPRTRQRSNILEPKKTLWDTVCDTVRRWFS